ncbi:unnamed protein product [Effrenium voratum]|uniref:Uncharacterized protein n=1 Tax=Effrenium voratum TaxID=2562239 RepID=A0AA36NJA9_9DINO|nr:unnamed protein product [Effrenium voratum]
MARREGLDKREDTTNYHSLGTVCTLRAALAVPVPLHLEIQIEEEKVHQTHWQNTEEMLEGNVFSAKTLSPTAAAAATVRALVVSILSHGFTHEVGAEGEALQSQSGRRLRAMAAQPAGGRGGRAAAAGLSRRGGARAAVGGHGTGGRQGRPGLPLRALRPDLPALRGGLRRRGHPRGAADLPPDQRSAAGPRPGGDGEFKLRELSQEEQEDPHLDLLSGFCVLDGRSRFFVIEGLREGHSFQELLSVIPRGPDAPKLLHNSDIGFGERLYASFGPLLKQVKVRGTLEKLSCRSSLYSWNKSVSEEDARANEVPKQLMALKGLERLRAARENTHFPKAPEIRQLQLLYGAYISDQELEGYPAQEAIKVKPKKSEKDAKGEKQLTTRLDHTATQKGVLEEALLGGQTIGGQTIGRQGTMRKATLKMPLNQTNAGYEQTTDLRKSASCQNFLKTNKELVRVQSDANVRLHDLLGKKRERETPFLEGEVYLYSSQKLNSAELQKDWMRKHMEGHESEKVWSYNPTYMSQNFEFAGAADPGVPKTLPARPNDSYARLPHDDRKVFRGVQARPQEAYRKPPRDLDPSRCELLNEPFEEGEWFRIDLGEERAKPLSVEHTFELHQVPHHRRYTDTPFDAQHMLKGEQHDFGPRSGFESVHYHGRRPDEDRQEQYLEHNIKEMEAAKSKIRFHHEMRTFSQGISRTGVTDLDRSELMLKDKATLPLRGRLDARFPESMHTMEPYHELGNPTLEWHARLRENDSSAPVDVNTGAHIKRDPEAGSGLKRSCMSGNLTRAPWRHEGTIPSLATAQAKNKASYVSKHDFNLPKPPQSRFCEDQLWKSASRTGISQKERSDTLTYKRPHHYGVHL